MAYEELRSIIANDAETKQLDIADDDLFVVYNYLLQRDKNDMKGFVPKLILEPFVHVSYVPTKEKLQEELNQSLKENLEAFESDVYIADAYLSDFEVSDEHQQKALDYAKAFLKEPKKFQKGLYVYGPYGTGKSYLLSGLANELTKKRVNVVYAFVPDLIRSLKGSIGENNLEKKINLLKRCDVLILDDLGGEHVSMWFRDEILLPVLHYRLNANLSVCISSNLSFADLAESLGDKEEDFTKVMRIIKRIEDLTKPFKLVKKFEND